MKDNLTFKKSRKALLKLLEKKDYDEISVADIVKECGFSRQNFYKNFSNKDELFKSIFMDVYRSFNIRCCCLLYCSNRKYVIFCL